MTRFWERQPRAGETLGLTGANIAICLILNGVELDEAREIGLEFGRRYGLVPLGTAEEEVLAWVKEQRP